MTTEMCKNKSRQRLTEILSKMPSDSKQDELASQAVDFDWNQPHCFSAAELENINSFSQTVTEQLKNSLKKYYGQNLHITAEDISQLFAQNIKDSNENSDNYYLGFTDEPGSIFGFLELGKSTAIGFVRRLLGDDETAKPDDSLSSLELSLLHDIAGEFINALADAFDCESLKPQGCVTESAGVLNFPLGSEVCKINFKSGFAEDKQNLQFSFLVLCDHIRSGILEKDKISNTPSADYKNIMIKNMSNINIEVKATLCREFFTLDEILSIDIGDVMVFDKSADSFINVSVSSGKLCSGRLAQQNGNYAITVKKLEVIR